MRKFILFLVALIFSFGFKEAKAQLVVSHTAIDPTCFEGNDGRIILNVDQGTGPFLYELFLVYNGSLYPIASSNVPVSDFSFEFSRAAGNIPDDPFVTLLGANDYRVDISDTSIGGIFGKTSRFITLGEPDELVPDFSGTIDNVNCESPYTGQIQGVSAIGGTPPYNIDLSGPQSDSFLNIGEGVSVQFEDLVHGNYAITFTDANNCVAQLTDIVVGDGRNINVPVLDADNKTVCFADPIPTFTATIDATGTGINWYSDAAGTNLIATGVTFNPATDGGAGAVNTYTYYVTQENTVTGCESDPEPFTLVINELPTLTLSAISVDACDNFDLQSLITDFDGANTYEYYLGDPDASGTLLPGSTVSDLGTNTYYIKVENGYSCTVKEAVEVTIDETPTADAGDPGQVCQVDIPGNTFAFTTSSLTGTGATGNWSHDGNGAFNAYDPADPSTAVYTFVLGDETLSQITFTLTVSSPNGNCAPVTDQVIVQINATPIVDAGADQTVCSNEVVALDGSFSGGATGITWTTSGDGIFDDVSDPKSNYTLGVNDISSGSVTLTITSNVNGSCDAVEDFINITIDPAVTTANAGSDDVSCDFVYQLNGNTPDASAGETGEWTVVPTTGAFDNANLPNATFSATAAGTYTFTWTITGTGVCPATSDDVSIEIFEESAASLASDQTICEGETANLTVSLTNTIGTYTVVLNDGTADLAAITGYTSGDNIPLNPTATTTYTLVSVTSESNACPATIVDAVAVVTVDEPVTAANAGSDDVSCDFVYQLNGNIPDASAGETGEWTVVPTTGAFDNANLPNATFSATVAGTYTFTWTITGTGVCPATSDDVSIEIFEESAASLASDQTICEGETANLTISLVNAIGTYTVVLNDGTADLAAITGYTSGDNIPLSPTATTTYTLVSVTSESNACPATIADAVAVVTVDEPVTAANAGSDDVSCDFVYQLNGNIPDASAGETGEWTVVPTTGAFDNANLPNATFSATVAGTYTFTWTITGTGVCPATSDDVSIEIFEESAASLASDQTICEGETANLTVSLVNAIGTYTVVLNDGTADLAAITGYTSGDNIPLSPTATTTYTLVSVTSESNACPATIADAVAVVTVDEPVTAANAGSDDTSCSFVYQLNGNTPDASAGETGEWTVVPTTGAFDNANLPNATFSATVAGTYTFTWTITGTGVCPATSDDVSIEIFEESAASLASDQTICEGETANLTVSLTNTIGTYTVVLNDGTADLAAITGYTSGDNIPLNPTATTTYTLVSVTSESNACPATIADAVAVVTVDEPVTAANAGSDDVSCDFVYQLNGNIPDASAGETGEWTVVPTTGAFDNANLPNATFSATVAGTYTFTWTITGTGVCPATSDDVSIEIFEESAASLASDQTICEGETANLTVSLVNAIGTYTVVLNDGTADLAAITGYTSGDNIPLSPTATTTYTLVSVTSESNACPATIADAVAVVTVDEPVTAANAGSDDTSCSFVYQLNGNTPDASAGETGEWTVVPTTGAFDNANLPNATFSATAAGTYTFTWTITGTGVCPATSDDVSIEIFEESAASLASDQTICEGETANLTVSLVNAIGTYTVVLNDGTADLAAITGYTSGDNIPLNPTATTTYTLVSVTSESNACPATIADAVAVVTVDEPVTAANAGSDDVSCDFVYQLNGNIPDASAGETGEWTVVPTTGAFDNANLPNATFSATVAGTYTFTWTITGTGVCPATSDDVSIEIFEESAASLASDQTICEGETANLTVSLTNTIGTYTVVLNDGTADLAAITGYTSGDNIPLNPTATTTYTLVSVISESNACPATIADAVAVVTVDGLITVDVGADQQICATDIVTLSGNISGDYDTFVWSTNGGDGVFTNENTLTPTYTPGVGDIANGSVNIILSAEKAGGICGIISDDLDVVINNLEFSVIANQSACESFDLNNAVDQLTSGANLTFYDGDPNAGGNVISAVVTADGAYWIEATLGSCSESLPVNVVITPLTNVTFNVTQVVNQNDRIVFAITSDGVTDLHGMQFSVQWDDMIFGNPMVNSFNSAISPAINPTTDIVFAPGNLTFSWSSDAVNAQTLANGEVLFEIQLDRLTCGGTGNIAISSIPTAIEVIVGEALCQANVSTNDSDFGIIDPVVVTLDRSQDEQSCNGNDGEIEVSATGGDLNYTFIWSDDASITISERTGLAPGSYEVIARDGFGCESAPLEVVINPSTNSPILTLEEVRDETVCNAADGYILLKVENGTPDYTFVWADDNTINSGERNNLTPGDYEVHVTDANGCNSNTLNITVNPSADGPVVTFTKTDEQNCNSHDGTIQVQVSGGTADYTYVWADDNTITTADRTGLAPGIYTVTVSDANGCTASPVDIEILPSSNRPVVLVDDKIDEGGCNANDGEITLSTTDGTAPFTYHWDDAPSETSNYRNNLAPGDYVVSSTDATGCTSDAITVTILPSSDQPIITLVDSEDESTCNANDGSIEISVLGGDGNYTYAWEDDATINLPIRTDLAPGTYTVTVTEGNGCVSDPFSVEILAAPNTPSVHLISKTDETGCNLNNGTIEVEGLGGLSPYTYVWADDASVTAATRDNLAPGTYEVYVQDDNGCQSTSIAIEILPSSDTPTIVLDTKTDETTCGANNGTITVEGQDGTSPYTYIWSDDATETAANRTNLAPGIYEVQAVDAAGCTSTPISIEILPSSDTPMISLVEKIDETGCNLGDGIIEVAGQGGIGVNYTYKWSDDASATEARRTGLAVGEYTISLIDEAGCESEAIVVEILPSTNTPVIVLDDSTDETSCNLNDGTITVSGQGGTGNGYVFNWSDDASITDGNRTGLAPGDYVVSVQDDAGCESTTITVTINRASNVPTVSIDEVIDEQSCNANDGEIRVSGQGGSTTGYTFIWEDDATITDGERLNLVPGDYTVSVQDASGCISDAVIVTVNPSGDAPTIVLDTKTDETTCGANNGTITVEGQDGTSPYTYIWSDDATETEAIRTNLAPGIYEVQAVDAAGCTSTPISIEILPSSDTPMISLVEKIDETGCNLGDGTIEVAGQGGTGVNYTYKWSDDASATEARRTGLAVGDYTISLIDEAGCESEAIVVEILPSTNTPVIVLDDATDETSCNLNDGTITVSGQGGTGNGYVFNWSDDASITDGNRTGLAPGDYTVSVQDDAGCESNTITVTINRASNVPTVSIDEVIDEQSCNANDGEIRVSGQGGSTTGYNFIWADDASITVGERLNLAPGDYTVSVQDASGCISDAVIVTVNPSGDAPTIVLDTKTDETTCGANNGTITVAGQDGTAPYTYIWSDDATETEAIRTNLAPGIYEVQAVDAAGCTSTPISIEILPSSDTPMISLVEKIDETGCNLGDGTIEVAGQGGTGVNYTYKWSDDASATEARRTGLAVGEYTISLIDEAGCESEAIVVEILPSTNTPVIVLDDATDETSCNLNDGTITVSGQGGTGNGYVFNWSDDASITDGNRTGLAPGDYTVSVQDDAGCESIAITVTINRAGDVPTVSIDEVIDEQSCNANDGEIRVSGQGGSTTGYTFIWADDASITVGERLNLAPGDYTVSVQDASGCISDAVIVTVNRAGDVPTVELDNKTDESTCNGKDGTITVIGQGGNGNYTFAWADDANITIGERTGLSREFIR
ncbi:hypothetical protein [Persicobacter sp. CCB-QB2]|uniref:Ig-like domain-containing protein n=1 Tax=Persicobacter sp. CCB-QB2 TaxID=1561025 RepID=UPI0006A98EA1|nr:hypothetical protein [Persicobacter sp. CCB-QB2]